MTKVIQKLAKERRKTKVRAKLPKTGFRLSVFRSNRYLQAQLIDQKTGRTILGMFEKKVLSKEESNGKTKKERAEIFGAKFGQAMLAQKINKAVFDRGPYHYHGRVKAFAEAVRSQGIKI